MARANAYVGVVLTVFSLYFVFESLQLPFWSEVGPGAGALPLIYGLLFGALSTALTVRGLRERRSAEVEDAGFAGWRVPTMVLGALFLAVLLAKTLGMLPTIFLFVAFYTLVVEKIRWPLALPVSATMAAGFYVVFEVWLGVPLVIGVFGI